MDLSESSFPPARVVCVRYGASLREVKGRRYYSSGESWRTPYLECSELELKDDLSSQKCLSPTILTGLGLINKIPSLPDHALD